MAEDMIVPFSKKTWSETVFEKLKELIENEFWKPGEKIYTESELCERFNVSRSTVREAMNMLKANNLVHAIPGAGTFVSKRKAAHVFAGGYQLDLRSEKALLDVMELRMAIEPFSASLAAIRFSEEEMDRLAELHNQYAADFDNGPQFFADADMDFHLFIAQATKNELIFGTMSSIKGYLLTQLITANHVFSHREISLAFHARIVDAIRKHDSEAAEDAMREHMSEATQFMLSIIDNVKSESQRLMARPVG